MHLHSRKPSAHRAGSSDVAREVTASVPARVDAPALEKTIRPPRSQLRRRCYLPGARWAPARPIQISSAGASTPAFLVTPHRRVIRRRPPHRAAGGGGLPDPSFLDQGWIAPPPRVQAMVTACVQLRGTWAASALSLSKGGTEGRVSLGA